MPATIAAAVAKFATAKIIAAVGIKSLAAAKVIYATAYAATYVGVTLGASYAANALLTDTPDADNAQGSIKQSIPPRIEAYGEGKLPGQFMLWEAKGNHAYDVMAFHHGRAEAIDEVWSHDHILTILPTGWVQGSDEYGGGDNDLIHIEKRLGLATETAYSAIVAALGATGVWTNDHRGDGIASIGVDYRHAKQENLLKDYPNGDPSWSAVGRWKRIWDPRFDSYSASRNTAVQIMDLLTSADGFAQDYEATVEPVLAHWIGEMNICDEAIVQKAGGTAPRYESFVYRALSDDPVEALKKLLSACDGRLTQDEDGCYRLWVGKYRAPTVFLTEDDIHGYDVAGDASTEDVVNELVPSFKSRDHGWNMVETDPWRDSDDAFMRGSVETSPFEQEGVTNNSQVRRLAKREMSRLLAPVRGRLDCKLSAARAMGQRWIGVDLPELGFDNAVIEIEEGGQTSLQGMTVAIPFVLADSNADTWNAATEEGDGPQVGDRIVREALAMPTINSVVVFTDSTGGSDGVRLRIVATGPTRDDLNWSARWRVVGSSSWVEGSYVDIDPGTPVLLETAFVAADDLEVEVAYTTGGGGMSPWSLPATADATVPSGPAEWTPTALGAALWGWWDLAKPATVSLSAGDVASIASGGPVAHAAQQTTPSLRPAYEAAGLMGGACATFADDARLTLASRSLGQFAMVMVGRINAGGEGVFEHLGANAHGALSTFSTFLIAKRNGGADGILNVGAWPVEGVISTVYENALTRVRLNGVTGTDSTASATLSTTAGTSVIGDLWGGGALMNGKIAGLTIVSGVVSSSDLQKLEGYLAWRHGAVAYLDAGHPYKSAPPTV